MKKILKKKILFIMFTCVIVLGICTTAFLVNANQITDEHTVPIAMAADDNYTYPTIVSITSLMVNSNEKTNYDIYIMTPGEFTQENKNKILNLEEKYNRCRIKLIDMQDKYKNANDKGHITTPAYYRLSLSNLLPNLDKIIWLDGDTLIFDDLTKLFNIDMKNYYYKGFLDNNINGTKDFGIENDHYICSGVMLVNLKDLRKDKVEDKFNEFIELNNEKLKQHDQTVINVVCGDKTGVLPAKYGIFNFSDMESAKMYASKLIAKNRYSKSEIKNAYKNPIILHCVVKPWKNLNFNQAELWWDYAEKTGYLDDIKQFYNI